MKTLFFLILSISLLGFAEEIELPSQSTQSIAVPEVKRQTHIYAAFGFNKGSGLDFALGCQYANGHNGLDVGVSAGYLFLIYGTEAHADYLFYPQKDKNNFFLGAGVAGGHHDEFFFGPHGYYWGPHACIGQRFETGKGNGRFWKVGVVRPQNEGFDEPFYNFSYGFLF